jgi:hypothetical protein
MNASMIAAIVVILSVQSYYVISEVKMTKRTTRGRDNSADKGNA